MDTNLTFRQRKERRDRLAAWFGEPAITPAEIDRRLANAAETEGDAVFAEMINILTHLEMAGPDARERWTRILEHQASMSDRMGQPVDLRVATLDFFLTIDRLIDNPKIVEIYVFDQAQESAITDGLTEVYNYRYFHLCLAQEVSRSRRFSKRFSVMLIDLDGFKEFNDACGHLAGDDALRQVSRILMDNTRGVDIVARYGGDEFVLLLPEVDEAGAVILAGRLIKRIQQAMFPGEERIPSGRLTGSCGVASFPKHGEDSRQLLMAADRALYAVKAGGKDDVRVAQDLEVPPEGDIETHTIDD